MTLAYRTPAAKLAEIVASMRCQRRAKIRQFRRLKI
jgi:hypothetical protein